MLEGVGNFLKIPIWASIFYFLFPPNLLVDEGRASTFDEHICSGQGIHRGGGSIPWGSWLACSYTDALHAVMERGCLAFSWLDMKLFACERANKGEIST